jgi:hypothetical protein
MILNRKQIRELINDLVSQNLITNIRLPKIGYKTIISFPTNLIPEALKSLNISNLGDNEFELKLNYG